MIAIYINVLQDMTIFVVNLCVVKCISFFFYLALPSLIFLIFFLFLVK